MNENTSRKSVWALTNRSNWNIEHWKYSVIVNNAWFIMPGERVSNHIDPILKGAMQKGQKGLQQQWWWLLGIVHGLSSAGQHRGEKLSLWALLASLRSVFFGPAENNTTLTFSFICFSFLPVLVFCSLQLFSELLNLFSEGQMVSWAGLNKRNSR